MEQIFQSIPILRWFCGGKKYRIGGRTYIQRPLVLAQVEQLTELIKTITFPENIDTLGIVTLLGGKVSHAVAIILTPRGIAPKDKDCSVLADELRYALNAEMTVRIIDDFFICNRLDSIFNRLNDIMQRIKGPNQAVGPKRSPVSSREETSPKGNQFCGDAPLPNVDPTSITGVEN